MISSKPLTAPNIELKQTRPLPLSKATNLEFGKTSQQQNLAYSEAEQNTKQQRLNRHINQLIEQQVEQIADTPTAPAKLSQHKPLALNQTQVPTEPLELLDLNKSLKPSSQLHTHKPLALGQNTATTHSVALPQHKPLALAEKPSSLDVQLLTEHSSALLLDPSQQLMTILQGLLKNTVAVPENSVYWLENMPTQAATQIATKDTAIPNLAWQASLWF